MNQGETELLQLLAEDLEGHFHRVVTAYQHRLYTVALRQTGNEQEAEDLAQDTLVQAYYALRRYPAARIRSLYLQSWLYRILLNRLYNSRHHLALIPMVPLDPSEDGPHLTIHNNELEQPDQVAESHEAIRELEQFVRLLPQRYRAPINLYYFEAYSQQEIADILQQPLGTIKSAIFRGTLLLRQELQNEMLRVRETYARQ